MRTSTITRTRFLRYREKFYAGVKKSPIKCSLKVISAIPTGGGFDAFVGESPRNENVVELPCLFSRNVSPAQRGKYGMEQPKDGIVYLAPRSLQEVLGYWKLDFRKTKVILHGVEYLAEKIFFQGEMYGDCIAVEITLKSDEKAG